MSLADQLLALLNAGLNALTVYLVRMALLEARIAAEQARKAREKVEETQ